MDYFKFISHILKIIFNFFFSSLISQFERIKEVKNVNMTTIKSPFYVLYHIIRS
jgi:hypothetical protein